MDGFFNRERVQFIACWINVTTYHVPNSFISLVHLSLYPSLYQLNFERIMSDPIGFPDELFEILLGFCSTPELLAISRTCKALHTKAVPLIYRKVDISAHNQGRLQFTHNDGSHFYHWSDNFPPKFELKPLAKSQQSFLSTILKYPQIGKHVLEFTWTVRSNWDPNGYIPHTMIFKATPPDTLMWEAFQQLNNVKKLDLAFLHESFDESYLREPPSSLFANATNIRLSGVMYRQVVNSVLHSVDLSKLEHLAVDNLQDPGHIGLVYPYKARGLTRAERDLNQLTESDELTFPGTMRGVLPLLHGRCTALHSFYFRKPGLAYNGTSQSRAADEKCYEEFAAFIVSVKSTLQSLTFEQGHLQRSGWHGRPSPVQRQRPMDEYFIRHALPALMGGDWPKLREVRILGVGRWKNVPAMTEKKKQDLQNALGVNVTLIIKDEPDRPCEFPPLWALWGDGIKEF